MSLSEAATGGNPDAGSLGAAGTAILSIALGTLVGWSVFGTIATRLPRTTSIAQPTVR